ncbi:hypothetical protein [Paenibacillus sp. MMO-58]|uniref:hypothetical protein n=1 Tax=Paenibacillus sp. MMO-58 TaxID=3081290 RepID=UPI003017AFCD
MLQSLFLLPLHVPWQPEGEPASAAFVLLVVGGMLLPDTETAQTATANKEAQETVVPTPSADVEESAAPESPSPSSTPSPIATPKTTAKPTATPATSIAPESDFCEVFETKWGRYGNEIKFLSFMTSSSCHPTFHGLILYLLKTQQTKRQPRSVAVFHYYNHIHIIVNFP